MSASLRFGSTARCFCVRDGVRLRREHFGGIAFDAHTGTTADLDRQAFALLEHMRAQGFWREESARGQPLPVLERLLQAGILSVPSPDEFAGHSRRESEAAPRAGSAAGWPAGPHLTAPHTVHWAITHACGADCPDCYARRQRCWFNGELSTAEALRLVDVLAAWGVFQLAVGGGEPLLRADLPAICEHARAQGLVVHVTTGQDRVGRNLLDALGTSVSVLQIGVHIDRILQDPAGEMVALGRLAQDAREAGLSLGANLMLSWTALMYFERLIHVLDQARLTRITLLRYKPPPTIEQWAREKPSAEMMQEFEHRLPAILKCHPHLTLRVDCALSYLQRHTPAAEALTSGVRGCVAGDRILAVAPDGSAFPCSQLVHPDLCAGDLLAGDPAVLWAEAPVLKRYRSFRARRGFRETACGVCTARAHCGGCRVFADDGWGADPGCPEPALPPPTALGKAGRRWDLEHRLAQDGFVKVAEYMARYGVGQGTAVRELRAAGWQHRKGATGRKRSDTYYSDWVDQVRDIQDSIGYTPAGFPFVTREEILGWQDGEWSYPAWLSGDLERASEPSRPRKGRRGRAPASRAASDTGDVPTEREFDEEEDPFHGGH